MSSEYRLLIVCNLSTNLRQSRSNFGQAFSYKLHLEFITHKFSAFQIVKTRPGSFLSLLFTSKVNEPSLVISSNFLGTESLHLVLEIFEMVQINWNCSSWDVDEEIPEKLIVDGNRLYSPENFGWMIYVIGFISSHLLVGAGGGDVYLGFFEFGAGGGDGERNCRGIGAGVGLTGRPDLSRGGLYSGSDLQGRATAAAHSMSLFWL